jgi:adenine-specific DNA-methyltransferase
LKSPLVVRKVALQELRNSSKWSGLVHKPTKVRTTTYTLADLFQVKRGLATGDNKFFVLSEQRVAELSIPYRFLKPILPSPRYLEGDIVDADETGNPLSIRKLFLLDCSLSEEEVVHFSEPLAKYLRSGREKTGITYICSHRKPWYSQELRPAAPFVCTYMGRGLKDRSKPFRFILNRSNATALNVYLMLYPKPILARALEKDVNLATKIWEILNRIPSEALLGEGRVYGGGLYKMEPKELANVPADEIVALLSKMPTSRMVQVEMFADLVA